jgi:hypothetical protein
MFSVPVGSAQKSTLGHHNHKSDTSRTAVSQITQLTPQQHWSSIDAQLKLVTFNKTAVHDFVSTAIFPKLNFFSGTDITKQYSTEKKSCVPW